MGSNWGGGLESEAAHKDPQAAQHGTLGFGEHVVTPVEGRFQRPMPRRTRPAAAGQQAKTVVEMCRDAPHPKRLDPGRRQFDRPQYYIELQANLRNDRSSVVD